MNGFEDWTIDDVIKHNAKIKNLDHKSKNKEIEDNIKTKEKKSKYGAIKTKIDEHIFDSKKEAEYYNELKLRLQCGDIKGFCLQPIFILAPGLKYKADFIIFNKDETAEIIDVKGFKTKEYITKKKIFENKFDLKIKEK